MTTDVVEVSILGVALLWTLKQVFPQLNGIVKIERSINFVRDDIKELTSTMKDFTNEYRENNKNVGQTKA